MIRVTVYTRAEVADATEQVHALLAELQAEVPHEVTTVAVDKDEALAQRLGELPQVRIGPYRLSPPFDRTRLLIALRAARDGQQQATTEVFMEDAFATRATMAIERVVWWFTHHWLLTINLMVALYVGGAFAAPVLMHAGAEAPARVLYRLYGGVCHQLAFRSWFLYGEQPAYPRAFAAPSGWQSFQQATGLDEGDRAQVLLAARRFLGNPQVGYKVALCERDVAIYGAILLFGLLYDLFRRRFKPLPLALWLLIGWVPIGVDGFSQLFSQAPFHLLPFRESTPWLRTLTGFLFGFTTAWFGYPRVEESMAETREWMAPRMARRTGSSPNNERESAGEGSSPSSPEQPEQA